MIMSALEVSPDSVYCLIMKCMVVVVNKDKRKSLSSSKKESSGQRVDSHVTVDSHNYEVIDNIFHLGTNQLTVFANRNCIRRITTIEK